MPICNHPRGDVTGAPCAACADAFCACGRRESECDGSRALCVSRKMPPRIDTEHRDAPVCPKCGAETRANTFMRESMDGAQYHSSCMTCGALFDVTVHVTVTYSTEVRS